MSFGDTSDDTTSEHEAPCTTRPKKIKKHKCPEPGCLATFTRPYRLKNHIQAQHDGLKPFKCHIEGCNKSYTNHSHLKRHIVVTHNESKPSDEVPCTEPNCGEIFTNKYNLKRHIKRAHQDLHFKCDKCEEGFKLRSLLHVHKFTKHDEETPFKCDKCSEMFVHLHAYNRHMERHKSYQCDCGQTYEKWTELLKHRREQCELPKQTYRCAICNKTFCFKNNLTEHCKLHLKESQNECFKCSYMYCNRSYKFKKNLTTHIRTFHEKFAEYFKCTSPGCEMVLKSKKNLSQHLHKCHSGEEKPKKQKKPRKDKGMMKKTMIAQLSEINVETERELNVDQAKSVNSKEEEAVIRSKRGNLDEAKNVDSKEEELQEILMKILPSQELQIIDSDVIVFEVNKDTELFSAISQSVGNLTSNVSIAPVESEIEFVRNELNQQTEVELPLVKIENK